MRAGHDEQIMAAAQPRRGGEPTTVQAATVVAANLWTRLPKRSEHCRPRLPQSLGRTDTFTNRAECSPCNNSRVPRREPVATKEMVMKDQQKLDELTAGMHRLEAKVRCGLEPGHQ
jgi:hypothetical protein